jgi:transposase-like protein
MTQTTTEATMAEDTAERLKDAIRVDTAELRGHVDGVVRLSVEETLNALLQTEADQICKAGRYERSPERVDTRAGHYERKLETKAGAVVLKMPKVRSLPFETAIIERYRRRESSVEEALVEMYLAGVSVRRVEDISEALWAPGPARARCRGSIRRSTATSKPGATARSKPSFRTSSSMAWC